MFGNSFTPFNVDSRNSCSYEEAEVVFVSDLFQDEYTGGAELTTEAIFKSAPLKTYKLKSSEVTQEKIHQGCKKLWVFFNFSGMDLNLIPQIVGNCFYYIVEYDYKFCKYRSIEKHKDTTGTECDCNKDQFGMFISAFFSGAEHIFWMSKAQSEIHEEKFKFLKEKSTSILSSVFDVKDLEHIEKLTILPILLGLWIIHTYPIYIATKI